MTIIDNKLIPDDGKLLYNGQSYSDLVYLGVNAKMEDWEEVDKSVIEELIEENEEG